MPPAFILSQDQTLHYEKFERIPEGMPCSLITSQGGVTAYATFPKERALLPSPIIQFIVTIALYFAAQLPRSFSCLR